MNDRHGHLDGPNPTDKMRLCSAKNDLHDGRLNSAISAHESLQGGRLAWPVVASLP